jgi:hypothetical protein
MLAANEFTVGTLANAEPLSLILPRTEYEETALVGHTSDGPAVVFLSGSRPFDWFPCVGNTHWKGLIIPQVRIEVGVASVFEPDSISGNIGAVIRTGTQLVIRARPIPPNGYAQIVLEDGHSPTQDFVAGFTTWQVVIGSGHDKRVLWNSDANTRSDA